MILSSLETSSVPHDVYFSLDTPQVVWSVAETSQLENVFDTFHLPVDGGPDRDPAMPYQVGRALPTFSIRQWRIVRESSLTISAHAPHAFCLLLLSRRSFKHAVSSLLGTRCQDDDNLVVLRQGDRAENGRIVRETFFQLCEGRLEECRVEMEGVDAFLKIVLFDGKLNMSPELLNDLIKPYGPIDLEELAEVVVQWDIDGCLDHEHFQQHIKLGKKLRRGKTLLQSAIEDGRTNLTRRLCRISETDVTEVDAEENNVFHLAARSGHRETIRALVPFNRREPIPARQGSVSSISSIDLAKLAMDVRNKVGDTPLAIASKEGHFAVALSLLLVDANPNIANRTTQCTPLHVAASKGYANIVKALLVFGADMTAKDGQGKTPVDQAAGYPKVMKCFTAFTDAVETGKTAAAVTYPQGDDNNGPFLLCMDGGGMKGLATCVLLRELEDRVRKANPQFVSLASYFDYVTGTSIGSYIAFSLAYRNLPMVDIMKLYFTFKDSILVHHRPYPEDKLIDVLYNLFTEDTLMSVVVEPKVIALTCKADTSPPTLHIMRNTGEARNGEKGPDELKVWEAARASSAAPTYFPPYGKFLDGGILANNPTVNCIGEVIDDLVAENREPRLGLVVSVGTGEPPPKKIDHINIPSISSPKDILAGAVGIKNFLILMLDQMTYAGGSHVAQSRAWCTSMKSPFFRLNPTLDVDVDLGETDDVKLVDLMFEALLCAKRERPQLDAMASVLLSRPPRPHV